MAAMRAALLSAVTPERLRELDHRMLTAARRLGCGPAADGLSVRQADRRAGPRPARPGRTQTTPGQPHAGRIVGAHPTHLPTPTRVRNLPPCGTRCRRTSVGRHE